ncbi:MAG: 50S ribosomal protein L6 [Candidatus Omnitrophica bacterium]|nr:50S ribosomal protein L6 [Candidatus Omnitrophota bacterium]MBU4345858.1 50S ribosomal protein L6 [Candidatus Omnitrophota bacterium]MBU4473329.1 50S ribosomal protein L6 [Candidatus Omnitrophota bacterium]MCG2706624.1 50S ribosomal protein L6 [Candidatus Omnitrophota bacterium]
MSRIGKKPVIIPKDVKIEVRDGFVHVEGPKGKLSRSLSDRINLEIKDNQLFVKRISDTKLDRSLHGLYRALIFNMVKGACEGYVKELEIVGIGFRAQVQGNNLNMQLGFSHPVNLAIPQGIEIETPKQTRIVVRGIDKEKVGAVASEIRAVCPPEPYKGKGIRFVGEYVKKKIGKAQAGTK